MLAIALQCGYHLVARRNVESRGRILGQIACNAHAMQAPGGVVLSTADHKKSHRAFPESLLRRREACADRKISSAPLRCNKIRQLAFTAGRTLMVLTCRLGAGTYGFWSDRLAEVVCPLAASARTLCQSYTGYFGRLMGGTG